MVTFRSIPDRKSEIPSLFESDSFSVPEIKESPMVTEKERDSGGEKEGESVLGRRWPMSVTEVTFLKDSSRIGCIICGAQ